MDDRSPSPPSNDPPRQLTMRNIQSWLSQYSNTMHTESVRQISGLTWYIDVYRGLVYTIGYGFLLIAKILTAIYQRMERYDSFRP
jgi:hypothetical protein